eukprot:5801900-Amphidinium_carterae.1
MGPGCDASPLHTNHSCLDREKTWKILLSDKENKKYYSVGVESGHFIKDAANQLRVQLAKTSASRPSLRAALDKRRDMKCLENEIVAALWQECSGIMGEGENAFRTHTHTSKYLN